MSKIAIITDSVACIPPDLVKKHNIIVAPVQVTWDRKTYRDGIDMTISEFYKRLRTSKTLPTTSSAIQGDYIQIYEGLRGKVDCAIVLAFSSDLGASFSSATAAKSVVSDLPVEIIDTRTVMTAQGFVVLEADRAAAKGGSKEEVIKAAQAVIPKVQIMWAMDTLEYLRRGGRVSLPKAVLAGWLKVKPITKVVNGKIEPIARTRTKPKAVDKLLELMASEVNSATPLHASVIHGDIPEEAEQLKQRVAEKFKPVEIIIGEITPVVGTHLGPGTLGLAYYNE